MCHAVPATSRNGDEAPAFKTSPDKWRKISWRQVEAWCWDLTLPCAPGKPCVPKHHRWCPLTCLVSPKTSQAQLPEETGASPGSPSSVSGQLGRTRVRVEICTPQPVLHTCGVNVSILGPAAERWSPTPGQSTQ